MRLSRWLFAGIGAVVGVLVMLTLAWDLFDDAQALQRGENAPFRVAWTGEWEPVARLQGVSGSIQDLGISRHGLYALFPQEWYRVAADSVSGPFGSSVAGSPGWMRSGQSIAVGDNGVLILDSGVRDISVWGLDGTYQDRKSVRTSGTAQVQWLQQLVMAPSGESAYVVANLRESDGPGRWIVMHLAENGGTAGVVFEMPVRDIPGGMYEIPSAHLRADRSLLLATTLEYRLIGVSAEGTVLFERRRHNFPRISIPDSARRAHTRTVSGTSVMSTRALQMPAYFPPVRSVYWRVDGRIMALISQGGDRFHIELLDAHSTPLGRLWDKPERGAFFLSSDAVYRVREEFDGVLIERQVLKLPDVDSHD